MILLIIYLILSGLNDGILEGWIFQQRRSFERKYNVDPSSFFGSLSYEKRYTTPNLWNKYLGVFDYYHVADDLRKLLYFLAAYELFKHTDKVPFLILLIGGFMVSGLFKKIGLNWIRK